MHNAKCVHPTMACHHLELYIHENYLVDFIVEQYESRMYPSIQLYTLNVQTCMCMNIVHVHVHEYWPQCCVWQASHDLG